MVVLRSNLVFGGQRVERYTKWIEQGRMGWVSNRTNGMFVTENNKEGRSGDHNESKLT